MVRAPHLVCYDIASDKARRRAFKMLGAQGRALQRSVFLVRLDSRCATALENELREMIGPGDAILVARLASAEGLPMPEVVII